MKKNKILRTINLIKNIICWSLVVVLALSLVMFFVSRVQGAPPTVFGYSFFRVSSGSMEPELSVGDIILDRTVDDPKSIQIGDTVTFKSHELGDIMVTHKVIVAPYEKNGRLMLQTQGIANELPDKPITADSVKGIMITKIPFLKEVYNVFLSPWGLLVLIALIILIFIDEIITIVKILTHNEKSVKDGESINDIIDRLQAENRGNGSDESSGKNEKADSGAEEENDEG